MAERFNPKEKSMDVSKQPSPEKFGLDARIKDQKIWDLIFDKLEATKINATTLANKILGLDEHLGDFVSDLFQQVNFETTTNQRLPKDWLLDVASIFNWDKVERTNPSIARYLLDGRMFLLGLGILDRDFRNQLKSFKIWDKLKDETLISLYDSLSDKGHQLYDFHESVPIWTDDPVKTASADLLGRKTFAAYLAQRIRAVPPSKGAYAIHLYAPWGAGKSTLLNFLKNELQPKGKKNNKWVVVEFNAWRHQHIQPPWWSLMDAVYKSINTELNILNRAKEYLWRFKTGRIQLILGFLIFSWLVMLLWPWIIQLISQGETPDENIKKIGGILKSIGEILGLAGTVWVGILTFNKHLLFGSAQTAQKYTELISDPMNKIKNRFSSLIQKTPKRVAIFIDDLDRCQSKFVIELLEGVQTLFREASVVFVVAADQQWLNACYEEEYKNMLPHLNPTGESLGTLFLEKAFRFSIPLPGVTKHRKEDYWLHLLNIQQNKVTEDIPTVNKWAEDQMKKVNTDEQVLNLLDGQASLSQLRKQKLQEAAVLRLANPQVVQRIEHTLRTYKELIDPNPRAMKRLVNTYSANRSISIITDLKIDKHQLVIWTILSSKWPSLTQTLTQFAISNPEKETIEILVEDNDLKGVLEDPKLRKILNGGEFGPPLLLETLRKCQKMQA